jgi:hypothetical protein
MVRPEIRALEERRHIDELSGAWRTIASSTPPWEVIEVDGRRVLMDTREQRRIGTLEGHWAPNVARYLNAISPYAGLQLAELLWLIGGHGSQDRIRQHALNLFHTMGLEQAPPARRGR